MLPPNAAWIANKVATTIWPERLHVHVLSEAMTGASSVWNAMLGIWNRVKTEPGWDPAAASPLLGGGAFPVKVDELTASDAAASPATAKPTSIMRVSRGVLDPARAAQALAALLGLDGLLGCAIADAGTGLVLSRELREDQPVDIELAAAASAQVLRAHRLAARNMGLTDPIEELITTAGARHLIMRALSRHPTLFVVALFDKHRTNLALARFQLSEVERSLY